jgi:hypothetical protein
MDADERDRVEVVVPLDDLVRDPRERPAELFLVQQDPVRRAYGRVRHSTPFRPRWTGLKGDVRGAAYADRPDGVVAAAASGFTG